VCKIADIPSQVF